jgi:GABA permease
VGAETRSQIVLSLLAWAVVLGAYAVVRRVAPAAVEAHTSEEGLAAERKADAWMHEHGAAGDLEVDAVVGEGPLSKDVIRRSDTEGYATQGP